LQTQTPSFFHIIETMQYLSEASTGLSSFELDAFKALVPWILLQKGSEAGVHETIMSTLLSVAPTDYINDTAAMARPIRLVLERAFHFGQLFNDSSRIERPATTSDIFTSDEPTETSFCAVTASGALAQYCGSEVSWAYHFILNGHLHPASREPVSKLLFFGPSTKSTLPDLFFIKEVRDTVTQAMTKKPNEVLELTTPMTGALFEIYHGVPSERSYSVNILCMPVSMYSDLLIHHLTPLNIHFLVQWETLLEEYIET